jgi:ketopantoate hydroxymethyltransferase
MKKHTSLHALELRQEKQDFYLVGARFWRVQASGCCVVISDLPFESYEHDETLQIFVWVNIGKEQAKMLAC